MRLRLDALDIPALDIPALTFDAPPFGCASIWMRWISLHPNVPY
jgi:hypothetical protein